MRGAVCVDELNAKVAKDLEVIQELSNRGRLHIHVVNATSVTSNAETTHTRVAAKVHLPQIPDGAHVIQDGESSFDAGGDQGLLVHRVETPFTETTGVLPIVFRPFHTLWEAVLTTNDLCQAAGTG